MKKEKQNRSWLMIWKKYPLCACILYFYCVDKKCTFSTIGFLTSRILDIWFSKSQIPNIRFKSKIRPVSDILQRYFKFLKFPIFREKIKISFVYLNFPDPASKSVEYVDPDPLKIHLIWILGNNAEFCEKFFILGRAALYRIRIFRPDLNSALYGC